MRDKTDGYNGYSQLEPLEVFASQQLMFGHLQKLYIALTFFILNLGFHIFNSVRRLHLKGDSLTREGFYKNLHLDQLLT